MTRYTSVLAARQHLFSLIEEALRDIGQHQFTQQPVTYRCRNRLAHWLRKPVQFTITTERLTFDYHPYATKVLNVQFDGLALDLHSPSDSAIPVLAAYPQRCDGIGEVIDDLWADTLDTSCPYSARIKQARQDFLDAITEVRSTATLDTVVRAIRNGREEIVELLFAVEQPLANQDDSELAVLVSQPPETILYQDDELALLLPDRQLEPTWRGGIDSMRLPPQEAFVVGRDDTPTGFFVHAVDGTHLTVDSNVTRDDIHEAMGFDQNLSSDTRVLNLSPDERVRLQGDLCLEYRRTANELRDWLATKYQAESERTVTTEFSDRFLSERNLEEYCDALEITGRGTDLQITIKRSDRGADAVQEIEQRFFTTRGWQPSTQIVSFRRYQRAAERLERRLINYLAAHADEYTERVEQQMETHIRTLFDSCTQLNLPIDNHLVLLGNAQLHPEEAAEREPVRIIVPDRTTLHVVHDEHPQVDVQLNPGEYSLQLLNRGLQPVTERPEW